MSHTRVVASIFLVALLLRVSALAIVPSLPLDTGAEVAYWGGAQLLTHGRGFADPSYPVYAPPLYAVFIASCLRLFGDHQVPVKLTQSVLDSLTSVVIYILMKEIFDAQTGVVSAAFIALYPFSIYLSISIASEPLFTFLLSIFMLLAFYGIRSRKTRYCCAAGVLLALATLTRGTTQFFPLIFLIFLIMLMPFKRLTKDLLIAYGAFIVAFAIVISPWALRNYTVLGDFVPVATAGGWVFLQGSTEIFFTSDALKEWPLYYESLLNRTDVPPKGSKPSKIDRFNARVGVENYKRRFHNDPLAFVSFVWKKFFRLWYAGESGRNDAIVLEVNLPIYLFALGGLILAWRKKMSLVWIPFGMVVYFILVHWISLPLFRYMMPIMPYLIGFAAFTVISIFYGMGGRLISVVPQLSSRRSDP